MFVQPEIGASMADEHVDFSKAAPVEESINPLSGALLALGMLLLDLLLPPQPQDFCLPLFEGAHFFCVFTHKFILCCVLGKKRILLASQKRNSIVRKSQDIPSVGVKAL
jgi:hypothetical protein